MNELILQLLGDLTVDGKHIPVKWLFYQGHGEPYVVFMQTDMDNSVSGDDEYIGYVDYYDFDVYSKGNYNNIIRAIREILEQNNFKWQVSRTSEDMYEDDTGYYHKTLCFAIMREE